MRTRPVGWGATGLFVVCASVASCTMENELRYTSTLQAETHGVALSDDGLDAHAAMSGTTCVIDAAWGCPTSDANLPSEDEVVLDHYQGVTLGRSVEGVHSIEGGVWVEADDVLVHGVRTAALYDDGKVVLTADEAGCWIQHGDDAPVAVNDDACAEGARYSVDHHDGTLFATTSGGVIAMERTALASMASAGDLLAWDASLHLLYTAFSGGDALRALDRKGREVWEVTSRGPIVSLAARGDRGEVLVSIEGEDGLGALERRDGENGRLLGSSSLPTDDGEIIASGNGMVVAISRFDEVHFFALDMGADGEPVVDPTPPECIDPNVVATAD